MKEYLVSIKRIQKINLIVSEKTSKKALNSYIIANTPSSIDDKG